MELKTLPEFDRLVLKACLEKDLINKKAVKQAVYDLASAHKPFFNIGSQHGSAMFAPEQSRFNSPRHQVYKEILEQVKLLKDHIDVSKTKEELELEKKMERQIAADELLAVDSRKDHLKDSILECQKKFNRKSELIKSRRNTIALMEQAPEDDSEEERNLKLPEIVKKE